MHSSWLNNVKRNHLWVLFCFLCYSCTTSNHDQELSKGSDISGEIDYLEDSIVNFHLLLLDSVANEAFIGKRYPLTELQDAIHFMEELTRINATADGTIIGRLDVEKSDVLAWKEWLAINRLYLRGDSSGHVIVDSMRLE